jgi:beta-lactamase regulating signal transducer with metallopeptidase domain
MNAIDMLLQKPAFQALGWALLHFIWQGALVASLFSLFGALTRKKSANLRYAAACGALVLLLILPIVTFSILFLSNRPASAASTLSSGSKALTRSLPSRDEYAATARDFPAGASQQTSVQAGASSNALPLASVGQSRPVTKLIRDKVTSFVPWLVALWLVGVIGLSIRFAGGLAFTRRLKRERNNEASPLWQEKAAALCARLRVSRPVLLCESALVEVPTVIGWLRPAILVPASALTGLTPEQLEALLAHELAHIRRYDYLVNLIQTAVETLLFYHPIVWWISNQIRIERENCCDDIAVATCGDVLTYARALADLEHLRDAIPQLALAASGGSLLTRIERLVGRARPGHRHQVAPQLAGLLTVAAVFAVLVSASGAFTPALAIGAIENKLVSAGMTGQIARFLRTEPKSDTAPNPQHSADAKQTDSTGADLLQKSANPASPEQVSRDIAAMENEPEGQDRDQARDSDRTQPATDYIDQMAAAGYKNLTIDQLIELKMQGVTADYIRAMKEAGYDKLSIHELIAMRIQGITPSYVREMAAAGFSHLSVEEIIGIRIQGVTPEYVQALKAQGYDSLPARTIISMKIQGVSPEYIKEMREAGFDKLAPHDLMSLRVQGVDPAYVKQMRDAGFDNLSARELAALRAQGVDPAYVREMRDSGFDKMSAHQLIALRVQGVTADYLHGMIAAGLKELSIDRIVGLKVQGVTREYIQQMKSIGLGDISISQIIGMRAQGIDPEYVKEMRALVSKDVSANDLVAMKIQGVDADLVNGMKRVGYPNLSAEQLISLKVQGVTPEHVMALKSAGYSSLSIREIIEAKIYGVTPEFIKQVKDRGFKDLTLRQLIKLKMAGLPGLTGEIEDRRQAPRAESMVIAEPGPRTAPRAQRTVIAEPNVRVAPRAEVRIRCAQPASAGSADQPVAPKPVNNCPRKSETTEQGVAPVTRIVTDLHYSKKTITVWCYKITGAIKSRKGESPIAITQKLKLRVTAVEKS